MTPSVRFVPVDDGSFILHTVQLELYTVRVATETVRACINTGNAFIHL